MNRLQQVTTHSPSVDLQRIEVWHKEKFPIGDGQSLCIKEL